MAIIPPFFEAGDAPFEHVFSGTYFQKIDKYHRISLPKEIRQMLSSRLGAWIVWKSAHVNAIEGTTEEIFAKTVHKHLAESSGDEREQIRHTAAVYANVYKVLDSDGRFTIPTPLRIGVEFYRTIVIVGMGAFFHIWPSEEYNKFYQHRVTDEQAVGERGDRGRLAM